MNSSGKGASCPGFAASMTEGEGAAGRLLYYLAGLTCTEETFMIKAGAQRVAAELGIAGFVRFEGWADQAKAAQLIAAADVL